MSSRKLNPASTADGHLHQQPYRKKYGKNLHKIHSQLSTTAPPPPIASLSFSTNASSINSKTGGNSASGSGGLLLLSTKKGNLDRKQKQGGGIGHEPSVVTSKTGSGKKGQSTHDALLSVLNGEKEGKKEFVPLAWGMKAPSQSQQDEDNVRDKVKAQTDKLRNHNTVTSSQSSCQQPRVNEHFSNDHSIEVESSSPRTRTCAPTSIEERYDNEQHSKGHSNLNGSAPERITMISSHPDNDMKYHSQSLSQSKSKSTPDKIESAEVPESSSRLAPEPISSLQPSKNKPNIMKYADTQPPPKEDQVEFMKKLAKERAEKRKLEEEKRVLAQKERAALRLKELELKMKVKGNDVPTSASAQTPTSTSTSRGGSQAQVRVQKSLYDPNRPYSSLLGGGGSKTFGISTAPAGTSILKGNNEPNTNLDVARNENADTTSNSMMHINNYGDRDRGSRANNGPRMLFDPKSGSMIAAPGSREKKNTKKKPVKSNMTISSNTDKKNWDGHSSGNSNLPVTDKNQDDDYDYDLDVDEEEVGGSRKKSSRFRQREASRKTKRKEDSKARKGLSTKNKAEDRTPKKGRTLPRTCGVLYKKDAKGNLVSADGCEGDQGYGAHSVRGGRIRNPNEYSAFKRKGRNAGKQNKRDAALDVDIAGDTPDSYNHTHLGQHVHKHPNISSHVEFDFNRGLNRSDFMPKNQQQSLQRVDDKVKNGSNIPPSVLPVDVVTGDEKLDLFSGLDESPKLQATAAAWAPSEAVLALAAASTNKSDQPLVQEIESQDEMSDSGVHTFSAMALIDNKQGDDKEEIGNNVDASPSIGLGLGFDPSKNMDSLMMSPAIEGQNVEVDTNIPHFTLKHSASMSKLSSNPFASPNGLLGSSTWGTPNNTNSMGSLSNWDLMGSSTSDKGNDAQKTESSSAFLSLGVGGSQTTWGTGHGNAFAGFNGIDGPSMGNSD